MRDDFSNRARYLFAVVTDRLRDVLDDDFLARASSKRAENASLAERIDVATAHGPTPTDESRAYILRRLKAKRAAWEAYLDAASATGMLDDDLRQRWRSSDEDSFRSAHAESLACWLLAAKLGAAITARPPGKGRSVVDLAAEIAGRRCFVEVKSPRRDIPEWGTWSGNDRDLLEKVLKSANSQLPDGEMNVLFLVPHLRTPLAAAEDDLLELLGTSVLVVPIRRDGEPPRPRRTEFQQNGVLLRPKQGGTTPPAFQNVSAIVSVEEHFVARAEYRQPFSLAELEARAGDEDFNAMAFARTFGLRYAEDHQVHVDHAVRVLHNPRATKPLPDSLFARFRQCVHRGDRMVWEDPSPESG